MREQIAEAIGFLDALEVRKMDQSVRRCEFSQNLAAETAGWPGGFGIAHDADFLDRSFVALADGFPNRHSLGADGAAEGGVFNIATSRQLSIFRVNRGPDGMFGVGGMGPCAGFFGGFEELLELYGVSRLHAFSILDKASKGKPWMAVKSSLSIFSTKAMPCFSIL